MMTKTAKTVKLTREEMKIADAALDQYAKTGKTDIFCPRCQSALLIRIGNSSESVSCVKGDFKMTVRGI